MSRGPRARRASDVQRTSAMIGLQTALLMVGVLIVFGALIFGVYDRDLDHTQQALLQGTTSHIDEPSEAEPGVLVTVIRHGHRSTSADLPAGLPDEAALARVQRTGVTEQGRYVAGDHAYLVRTVRMPDRVVQAAIDLHDQDEQRQRVLTALLIAGVVGVVLSGLVSVWLARRAVRPLSDSLARQRRFVADASHELRTPLTHLHTRVQMLARRSGPLDGRDLAPVVEDTRALAEILDDLLAATDTRERLRERVDLAALVEGCEVAARPYAAERGIALGLSVVPAEVSSGVPTALRRAVTALIDNALDHAHQQVEIALSVSRRAAVVTVADDGPGISPEAAPRVFERFAGGRIEDASGRRHYGIGLALVADVAAAHGGTVTTEPRAEGLPGTVFRLRLPR